MAILLVSLTAAGAVAAQCVGDCNADGEVTVDEIITGVNIALGTANLSACANFDGSGDGEVTIDELLQGVNTALLGCGPAPSATPQSTPTATPTLETPLPSRTPTATATFSGPLPGAAALGRNVAGRALLIANGLAAFPPLITAIMTGLQAPESALAPALEPGGGGGAVSQCPNGGQVERTCTGVGNVVITISFLGCALPAPEGSLTFDQGTITLRGFGTCPNVVVAAPSLDETIELSTTLRDAHGMPILTSTASLNGSVTDIGISPGATCFLSTGTVNLNGTIRTQFAAGVGAVVQFDNTSTRFSITQFSEDCVPLRYSLTFNGHETISEPTSGAVFDVQLSEFVTSYDANTLPPQTELSGQLQSTCIADGQVSFVTVRPFSKPLTSACADAGELSVTFGSTHAEVQYRAEGHVSVDADGSGSVVETYASCLDPALLQCL